MAKKKAMGWEHEGGRYGRATKDEEDQVKHRQEMEAKCLRQLCEDLGPHILGCTAKYVRGPYSDSVNITMEGLPPRLEAIVRFRYEDYGFSGKGRAAGISVKADGIFGEIEALGRSYGFDFETNRMSPASVQKMGAVIVGHLQKHLNVRKRKTKNHGASERHANEMAELLRAEGFNVRVDELGEEARQLNVEGVVILRVSASGLASSTGRFESVPIRAKAGNIVQVVKTIAELRRFIHEGSHGK
jgi:hypothetical protein